MNPFKHKPKASMMDQVYSWKDVCVKPYDKNTADPYTKARIILMNGIETEAVIFGHNFHRNCTDQDLRRELAMVRRAEQQQQKRINWQSPGNESQLEVTIGYEHLAVDLTAWLAMHEPDSYNKQCMDFALLEDFDHLYRYADLLKMNKNIPAHKLVQDYVEITPGRPTIAHHRHPFEAVKKPGNAKKMDLRSMLGALILTAGEQQTMNWYMNIGSTYEEQEGRDLYAEIAMVEEQHVTHYGALLDPSSTWLENLLMREYMECYLYYSFYSSEVDAGVKQMWEAHYEQELCHLHKAAELLQKYEGKEWQQVLPGGEGDYPELLVFAPTKDYVRDILEAQATLTADGEQFKDINDIPADHEFFAWQAAVNGKNADEVPSHGVIAMVQKAEGEDYREEDKESARPELRDRKEDNTTLGRVQTQKA